MTDAATPVSDGGEAVRSAGGSPADRHFLRLIVIWVVLSAIADPIFYYLVGPHVPPGALTSNAAGAQFDFNILLIIALPVMIAIWVYMVYALVNWRASRGGPEPVAGASARGNLRLQIGWIGITTAIVLGLFVFGTYELVVPAGAGGGEGPNPVWTPASHDVLPIQVIAQQWEFSYRYPTFGGFETNTLFIPAHTTIAFHVTSLDVIHSFWAYQLGVKADANPGQDNVAYTTTTDALGQVTIRCSELCGIWHGAMFNYGHVVSMSSFLAWAQSSKTTLASATKLLPPFAWTYVPDANGAAGSYYPDNHDQYSKIQTYGSQKVNP